MNLSIYLISYVIIIVSVIGYSLFFQSILKNSIDIEFEYNILGSLLFLISLSYLTHFFFKHGYIHNLIIAFIGIISFIFYFIQNKKLLIHDNVFIYVSSVSIDRQAYQSK